MGNTQNKPTFWGNYDPEKHAALIRAKNQSRLVWFAIAYLSGTTLFFMFIIAAVALGKAVLPDRMINVIATLTVGQFAGAPILLYRAMFRREGGAK